LSCRNQATALDKHTFKAREIWFYDIISLLIYHLIFKVVSSRFPDMYLLLASFVASQYKIFEKGDILHKNRNKLSNLVKLQFPKETSSKSINLLRLSQ